MSDHTPGPWQVLGEYGEPYLPLLVVAKDGYRVARFRPDETPIVKYSRIQIANARLIASAPEMARELELLREVIKAFEARTLWFQYPKLDAAVTAYRKEFP